MAVNLSPYGGVGAQFLDNAGNVLTGGRIETYAAGTTTPQAVYTDSTGITFHPNPIILDASGRVPSGGEIWLTDGLLYKFVLRDSNNVLIATYDNIAGINSNFVNFTNAQEIQTATAGQTVFNLTTTSYQPGTNSLSVFVDGVNQYGPGAQYAYLETDSDTVTFVNGLHVGALVKFTTSQLNSSGATDASQVSYDPPFTNSVVTTVENKLSQIVSVQDFGAVGDGIADDTTAINNAISAVGIGGALYFPKGTYLTTNTIDLRRRFVQATEATISGNHANIIVIAGGNSASGNNPSQWIGTVSRVGGVTATPDIRIMGAKGQHIGVQRAEYLQIYADTDNATTTSCAYSSFWFKYATKLELTANFATTGSSVQWINENEFFLNRTDEFIMDGTYAHNNNRFYGGTFEGSTITINRGQSNTFNNVRFEGTNTVTFGANADYNTIIQSWISSTAPWNTELVSATVVDNGIGNTVVRQESINRVTHIVGSASAADVVLNNAVNFSGRTPALAVVRGGPSQGDIFITDFVRVYKNDTMGFYTSQQGATVPLYRITVYFYDINKQPVTPVLNTNFVSSSITSIGAGFVSNSTGQSQAVLGLIDSSVAYVKIFIHGSSGAQALLQYANDVSAFVRRSNNASPLARNNAIPYSTFINASPYAVTAIPTQGYAPLGYEAVNTNGLVRYVVTRSIDTALTNAASGGATSIVVNNATGVTNGDIVGILNDDIFVTNWTTVSSVAGTTIGLTAGLTGACAVGNRVVFVKWTTITY